MLQPHTARRLVPSHRFDTDVDTDVTPFRNLAGAVVRQALDDLAVRAERQHAKGFLAYEFWDSLWRDWLGEDAVSRAMMARAVARGVRRRIDARHPRPAHRITAEPAGADDA